MKTKLVNYRTYKGNKSEIVPIDRRSIFGNPFKMYRDGIRSEVIELYKHWFTAKIKKDKKFRKAVYKLKGKTLGCWCIPLSCHGDIIIEYLENSDEEKISNYSC